MADPVQAFRAISWLIAKWILILLAGLIGLTAAGIGIFFAQRWYFYDRHVANIDPRIFFEKCETPGFPILVVFHNQSTRTIERVTFNLVAKMKGRSTNIAEYRSLESDFIVKPGEGYGTCYSLPKFSEQVSDFKVLEWTVRDAYYTFSP